MKYYIFTLGCQMNIADSWRIAQVMNLCGFKSSTEKQADVIIVNACSVRQKAVDRIWGRLKKWAKQKKKILLTGCILSADKKKFKDKVDLIFSISDLSGLPKFFNKKNIKTGDYLKIEPKIPRLLTPERSDGGQAKKTKEIYIPIMTGCNNFCTYCAVPYTRGREYSRPEKEIICEVKNALKCGYNLITLLGQNVDSYGISNMRDASQKIDRQTPPRSGGVKRAIFWRGEQPFVNLLQKLVRIDGHFQIKFLSPNPQDFPKKLINLIAKEPKLSKEIHLPLQSGDDEILRQMNRKYTTNQFLKLIGKIKLQIPNLKLSTDIIVGFPGETKEQFQNTLKLCQKIGFDKAFVSQYSPRPGTASAKMPDDVPPAEKKRRWEILNKLINK